MPCKSFHYSCAGDSLNRGNYETNKYYELCLQDQRVTFSLRIHACYIFNVLFTESSPY